MTKNAYQIRDLQYAYPAKGRRSEAVLRIDALAVRQGIVTVIRGHNGSGKSTLLKLLAGLLQPQTGTLQSAARAVMVQQEPYLFHGSVEYNLLAPLRFLKLRPETDGVRRTLALVGLEGFETRKARELSGGETKRLAIARALMARPEILLLDEPDANVDEATSAALEALILSLRAQGMTIILCSHRKGFAYRTADAMIDLFQGRPVEHDENIFKGECHYDEGLHSTFASEGHSFRCPTRQGHFSCAVIPPENISLSRATAVSEVENQFTGRVTSITPFKDGRVTVGVDCEGWAFKTRLCGTVLTVEKYALGETITVLFNPSAVRLY